MPLQTMRVKFSYLDKQFEYLDPYLEDIRQLVRTGDFTLGAPLIEFERRFAALCGLPYAIGVGTGTDALILSLKAVGIQPGDEVITTPTTFIATVGAIVAAGARPVFVDSEEGFVMDPAKIEPAVTSKTKAIVPIHYTGNVADMPTIMKIAERHHLQIIEDACQSIAASLDGNPVGSWGAAACFSLHPLKNLNVWGDGGAIVTRSREVAEKLKLFRNHGLTSRDEAEIFGVNCRLDTLQAVIGNRLIGDVGWITERRIAQAQKYDTAFRKLSPSVEVPPRRPGVKHVFHLYMIRVKRRDELLKYLIENGIEAKVHYPIPVHLQKAAAFLGYQRGDFPKSEEDSLKIITLPAHQHLSEEETDYVIERVKNFYQ